MVALNIEYRRDNNKYRSLQRLVFKEKKKEEQKENNKKKAVGLVFKKQSQKKAVVDVDNQECEGCSTTDISVNNEDISQSTRFLANVQKETKTSLKKGTSVLNQKVKIDKEEKSLAPKQDIKIVKKEENHEMESSQSFTGSIINKVNSIFYKKNNYTLRKIKINNNFLKIFNLENAKVSAILIEKEDRKSLVKIEISGIGYKIEIFPVRHKKKIYFFTKEGFVINEHSVLNIQNQPPVDKVSISSRFCGRFHPVLRRFRFHYGTDFKGKCGDKVYSIQNGTVTVGKNGGWGNFIIVDHGPYITLYAHLSKVIAKDGQTIKRGQIIGFLGNTGLSAGFHLHLEIKKGGRRGENVNPEFNYIIPTGKLHPKHMSKLKKKIDNSAILKHS